MTCSRTRCLPRLFAIPVMFSLILTLRTTHVAAQVSQKAYVPEKVDSLLLDDTLRKVKARFDREVSTLQGENHRYIADVYKERYDYVAAMFHEKALLTLPYAQVYLNSLVNEIRRSNPALQAIPMNVYFARTGVPNAASMGDGVIVFNLGLFIHMENESQAAFVLCHEFAHLYLEHGNKAIATYVNTLYSKETQKELRHIRNEQYNKRAAAEGLAKAFSFDNTRHSRDHEREADSVGLLFLEHTRFDPREALKALALLDDVDKDDFPVTTYMRQVFSAPDYPFQSRWLRQESGLLGGHAVIQRDAALEDSLKTHPDCKARLTSLAAIVDGYANTGKMTDPIDKRRFDSLKSIFPYEIIRYYYDDQDYSRALLSGLELLNDRPKDPYVVAMIGRTFDQMTDAQKNHTLGKVVPLPSPNFPEVYDTLLQFLQNLHLEEMISINYHFLKPYQASLSGYRDYSAAWEKSRQYAGK